MYMQMQKHLITYILCLSALQFFYHYLVLKNLQCWNGNSVYLYNYYFWLVSLVNYNEVNEFKIVLTTLLLNSTLI